jgi:hypothetical protein
MRFWIGQAVLLLLCIALPFMAATYVDTQSEIRRAEQAGAVAAKLAGQNLESRLKLEAHDAVNKALNVAQKISERDLIGETNKPKERRDAAVAQLQAILAESTGVGGFAWYADETGTVVAETGQKAPEGEPRRISGHPLFRETQDGWALDGMWIEGGRVALVGAAPLAVKGQAVGAVLIGTPIDKTFVASISNRLNTQVTLVAGGKPLTSTFDDALAATIVGAVGDSLEAVPAGSLPADAEIKHPFVPMLPLFMPHDASGVAYSSLSLRAPGLDGLSWVVSAPVGELLRNLPERQEILLGGLVAFLMLALLIGLVNYRLFVVPIARITDHLSELQFGRGELELAEARVSGPFRRLVKLINMTVQKIPSRGFSTSRTMDSSPISELPPAPMQAPREIQIPGMARTNDLRLDRERGETPVVSSSAPSTPMPPPQDYVTAPPASSPLQPQSMLAEHPFGDDDALADAVAAMSTPRAMKHPASQSEPRGRVEDEAAAIAAAIASLEAPMPQPKPRGTSGIKQSTQELAAPKIPGRKTAADIRGVPSDSLHSTPSPFPPSASEMFRGGSNPALAPSDELTPVDQIAMRQTVPTPGATATRPPQQTVPRGGGSLDLNAYAALGASAGVQQGEARIDEGGFNPEATVVAPVTDELLRKSASRDETTSTYRVPNLGGGDMTMVANVPPNLIAQTLAGADDGLDDQGLDAADHAHFKETYERFLEMRKRCGEPTSDLAFDRFLQKLAKNREGLIKKYNCRTVRFQVYEKDGKAALKATPVRAR